MKYKKKISYEFDALLFNGNNFLEVIDFINKGNIQIVKKDGAINTLFIDVQEIYQNFYIFYDETGILQQYSKEHFEKEFKESV